MSSELHSIVVPMYNAAAWIDAAECAGSPVENLERAITLEVGDGGRAIRPGAHQLRPPGEQGAVDAVDVAARGVPMAAHHDLPEAVTIKVRENGPYKVDGDDGVDIFINDQFAGTTPIPPFTLKPGVYDLRYKFKQMDLGHETVTVSPGEPARSSVGALLGSLELFVVPASETVMQIDDDAPAPVDTHVMVRPGKHRLTFAAGGYQTQTMFVSVDAGMRRNVSAILQPAIPGPPLSLSPSSTPVQTRLQTPTDTQNNASSVATAKGTLAVSSLVPVEIYLDNNHVGTTPVTLELPVGTYTFEYRYGNLRKTSVNVIKSNEVTRATAAFDVSIESGTSPPSRSRTGSTRRNSSSADTLAEPGRVDSPPMSTIAAPSSTMRRAAAAETSGSRWTPPSENESGVTLTTPITDGRGNRSSTGITLQILARASRNG